MEQATIPNLVTRRNYSELEKRADEYIENDDSNGFLLTRLVIIHTLNCRFKLLETAQIHRPETVPRPPSCEFGELLSYIL